MKPLFWVVVVVAIVAVAVAGVFAYLSYGSGTLRIQLSDPPVNWRPATQVYLNYSAIEVHRADAGNDSSWFTTMNTGGWINLTQTLDVNQTIGSQNLQAGKYNLIRFQILEAKITVRGVNFTAKVPSGKLQIAITQGGVQVNAGQTSTLLMELEIKIQVSGTQTVVYSLVPDIRATPV
jgi:hypothetical protein